VTAIPSIAENPITCVRGAIQNPGEPRHFMVLKPLAHEVVAIRGGRVIARSRAAVRSQEAGLDLYDPVVYFPRADVDTELLRRNARTSFCPLKGRAEHFDLVLGDRIVELAARSYREVVDFDPRIEVLRDRIAFDGKIVQVIEYTVADDAPPG